LNDIRGIYGIKNEKDNMKILKTASGKQQLKLSKKEWESMGKRAGWIKVAYDEYSPWEEEARRRGRDDDDAYDMRRDYGGDIDSARQDTSTMIDTPSTPAETVEPERNKFDRWNGSRHVELSDEVQEERQSQRLDMVTTLASELDLDTYKKPSATGWNSFTETTKSIITPDTGKPMINASPWGKPDGYPYLDKIRARLDEGASEGRWDSYLANEIYDEIKNSYDSSIR